MSLRKEYEKNWLFISLVKNSKKFILHYKEKILKLSTKKYSKNQNFTMITVNQFRPYILLLFVHPSPNDNCFKHS